MCALTQCIISIGGGMAGVVDIVLICIHVIKDIIPLVTLTLPASVLAQQVEYSTHCRALKMEISEMFKLTVIFSKLLVELQTDRGRSLISCCNHY